MENVHDGIADFSAGAVALVGQDRNEESLSKPPADERPELGGIPCMPNKFVSILFGDIPAEAVSRSSFLHSSGRECLVQRRLLHQSLGVEGLIPF